MHAKKGGRNIAAESSKRVYSLDGPKPRRKLAAGLILDTINGFLLDRVREKIWNNAKDKEQGGNLVEDLCTTLRLTKGSQGASGSGNSQEAHQACRLCKWWSSRVGGSRTSDKSCRGFMHDYLKAKNAQARVILPKMHAEANFFANLAIALLTVALFHFGQWFYRGRHRQLHWGFALTLLVVALLCYLGARRREGEVIRRELQFLAIVSAEERNRRSRLQATHQ